MCTAFTGVVPLDFWPVGQGVCEVGRGIAVGGDAANEIGGSYDQVPAA